MSMMAMAISRIRVVLGATGLALVAAACGSSNPGPGSAFELPGGSVRVEVENRNFADATIYAFDGTARQRLGRVGGKSIETFTFRWYQDQIAMIVDFTGGGEIASEIASVHPELGEDFRLTIGASSANRVTLRPRGSQ